MDVATDNNAVSYFPWDCGLVQSAGAQICAGVLSGPLDDSVNNLTGCFKEMIIFSRGEKRKKFWSKDEIVFQ